MIIKINDITTRHTGNPALGRNAKEERETGKLEVVSTRNTRYETYDKVDITTDFGTEQYLVQADNPVQLNKNDYQHNLTLIENAAIFDEVRPADRSFRVIGQTLGEILLVYKRELSTYHNIVITYSTLDTATLNTTIPFKVFTGLNFSQILQSLFRRIWAIPKANRIGNTWDIYPQYHNERNNEITEESITLSWQQNNIDYATRIKSQLKNAVNERNETDVTWFPSANGYVLPRTSSLEKITSNLQYELDSKIVSLLKVEAVDVYFILDSLTGGPQINDTLTLDITSQVVQEDIWDLLPTTSAVDDNTDNTRNHIRYKPLDKFITNLYEAGTDNIIFTVNTTYLLNAIRRVLIRDGDDYYDTDNYKFASIGSLDTESVKLRFKYVRQRDIDIVHSRKTRGAMNYSTSIHQQRDSSIEAGQYLRNLKFYSNRMGNNTYSKSKVFKDGTTPYEVFDYTGEKTIVTNVLNTYHNGYVYCEYEESENWANIEAEYALMQTSDPYDITVKSVTTNLVAEEYIEFSETNRTDESKLTSTAKRLLLGQFESVSMTDEKVAVGVFKPSLPSWNDAYGIRMPIEPTAEGNAVAIHVFFDNQTIAGKTYYDIDNTTYQNYLNPLPYTDSDGRLENFELYFTPDVQFQDAGEYPLILVESTYEALAYTTTGTPEPIDLDSNAAFAYTYVISYVADERIYIGDKVARDNYFTNAQATTSAVEIYSSSKPYGQFDQTPRSYDTDITSVTSYSYNYTTGVITVTPSSDIDYWCIAKDGEILLAFNRTIFSGVDYTLFTNAISEITKIVGLEYEEELTAFLTTNFDLVSNETIFKENMLTSILATDFDLVGNETVFKENTLTSILATAFILSANEPIESEFTITSSLTTTFVLSTNEPIEEENIISSILATSFVLSENSSGVYENTIDSYLGTDFSLSANPSPVEWVVVASGTPTTNQCLFTSDVGNIKQEDITTCTFEQIGSTYTSSTDLSTSRPSCSQGAQYTTCFYDETFQIWACQDFEANEETETVTYECQLK